MNIGRLEQINKQLDFILYLEIIDSMRIKDLKTLNLPKDTFKKIKKELIRIKVNKLKLKIAGFIAASFFVNILIALYIILVLTYKLNDITLIQLMLLGVLNVYTLDKSLVYRKLKKKEIGLIISNIIKELKENNINILKLGFE